MVSMSTRRFYKAASRPDAPDPRFKSRKSVGLAGVATLGLVGTLLVPALAAQAATGDSLNVGFNGSLVGTTAYTTTGDEIMRGTLTRIAGGEEQIPGQGVKLNGGTQGLRYRSTDMTTGDATADQGFLGEVKFTPTGAADLSTVFSAGGNFYIRAQGGELRYGFDSLNGSTWTPHRASVPYPALNAEHTVSFHYLPTAAGVTLNVMLDGELLPPVTSTAPAKNADGLGATFGFGHEVNSGAAGRGFTGTLHEVRVARAVEAFKASAFEMQPQPASTDLLDVGYSGTFAGNAYTPAAGELVTGTVVRRAGTETLTGGTLTLGTPAEGVDYTATDFTLGGTTVNKGFVAEAVFTPTTTQVAQGTVIAVGGNLFARYNNTANAFEYGFSSNASGSWKTVSESVPLPELNKPHTFSMVYVPKPDGTAELIAGMDGALLPTVKGEQAVKNPAATTTASFGAEIAPSANNRAFKGSLDKTRFAALTQGYDASAVKYQNLVQTEPEVCQPLMADPGNYVSVSTGDCEANVLAKSAMVRPTMNQLKWQETDQTAFVHFGINTFYDQEWGHGTEDPARFNPTDFDADSWVKTLRDNGFRYTVLTVKHHDGFMSYPSRYTDYTVASSPWKNGKGDVVKEFTDAARKYGMKVGLYMSPADSNQELDDGVFGNGSPKSERTIPTLVAGDDRAGKDIPTFKYQATDYGAFFLNTLYEVLTQYGQVDEVWFDGAQGNTGKREFYDYPAFYDMIAKLQPNALVAVGGNDIRWIGNEQGVARENEWAVLPINKPADGGKVDFVHSGSDATLGGRSSLLSAVKTGAANSLHWWPGEADMKLTGGWFAHPNDTPKPPNVMMEKYYQSVGRNSVLLLNVPPTTTGRFAQSSVTALEGFTQARAKSFSNDLALGKNVTIGGEATTFLTDNNNRTGSTQPMTPGTALTVDLGSAQAVSNISLSEHVLNHGQTVEKFTVDAKVNGTWSKVIEGGTIGVKRILKFPSTVTAQEFRVTINENRAATHLSNISLYNELAAAPAPLMELFVDCKAPVAGIGTQERPLNSLEQFRQREIASGATIRFKNGTDCVASDTPFWGYGTAEKPITVSSYGEGAPARIDGKPLAATFAPLAAQGWVVEAQEEPATPAVAVSDSTVVAGEATSLAISGFAPGQEVSIQLRPEAALQRAGEVVLATVTTDAQGAATADVTIPADTAAGSFSLVAVQGDLSASALLTITAAAVVPPPVEEPVPNNPGGGGTPPVGDGTVPGAGAGAGSGAGAGAGNVVVAGDGTVVIAGTGDLANTGANSATLLFLGLTLLLCGGAAAIMVRRRRRQA